MTALPRGWAEAPLSSLGVWCGGGTPSKRVPAFWQNGTLPWVSPKDMKVDVIQDSEDHITEAALRASATNLVESGSVLVVTRSGILQHTLPVALTSRPVTINQDLKALIPYPGVVPEYVAWELRANARRILRDCSKAGTTVQSIETTQLLRFVLSIAPTAEQKRIVAAIEEQFSHLDAGVSAIEHVIGPLTNAQAGRVAALRQSILSAAFSGKLTPQDPSDEPASLLLLRIAASAPLNGRKSTGRYRHRAKSLGTPA
jgi:type I restriction enzyme, S subunit